MRLLKPSLYVVGVVQIVLGIALLVPGLFADMMGMDTAPEWVNWMFAMFAARSLAMGFGMFVAARDPKRHIAWIHAMIGVQAIDWIATVAYLTAGSVSLAEVTTAAFLPIVFIAVLVTGLRQIDGDPG